jgi:hypothetical protein
MDWSSVLIRVHRCPSVVNQPETHIADGFTAKALFQFSQDVELGNLFELVLLIVLVLDRLTKAGGCRTNEAPRFRRNRKFLRQIPKERQKLFGFAERRLPTPPPGASASPCCQLFRNQ